MVTCLNFKIFMAIEHLHLNIPWVFQTFLKLSNVVFTKFFLKLCFHVIFSLLFDMLVFFFDQNLTCLSSTMCTGAGEGNFHRYILHYSNSLFTIWWRPSRFSSADPTHTTSPARQLGRQVGAGVPRQMQPRVKLLLRQGQWGPVSGTACASATTSSTMQ